MKTSVECSSTWKLKRRWVVVVQSEFSGLSPLPSPILYSSIYSKEDSQSRSLHSWRAPSLCLQCYLCEADPDTPRSASPLSPKPLCWHRKRGPPSGSPRVGRFLFLLIPVHLCSICWSEVLVCFVMITSFKK